MGQIIGSTASFLGYFKVRKSILFGRVLSESRRYKLIFGNVFHTRATKTNICGHLCRNIFCGCSYTVFLCWKLVWNPLETFSAILFWKDRSASTIIRTRVKRDWNRAPFPLDKLLACGPELSSSRRWWSPSSSPLLLRACCAATQGENLGTIPTSPRLETNLQKLSKLTNSKN